MRMQAGMTSINDFATTYMCQSLPFGGVKDSGFDRFAGIEGLRGMCTPKAVCEDRSALLQYPPCAGSIGQDCLLPLTASPCIACNSPHCSCAGALGLTAL